MSTQRMTFYFATLVALMLANSAQAMLHSRIGRFMQRDPLDYVDSSCLYEYQMANSVTRLDPRGAEVAMEFDRTKGTLAYQEYDRSTEGKIEWKGDLVTITGVFSGSGESKNKPSDEHIKSQGPTPGGTYLVGEMNSRGWHKLYGQGTDGKFRDSVNVTDPNGNNVSRDGMYLHHGTMSIGCVTVPDKDAFDKLQKTLNSTKPFVPNSNKPDDKFPGHMLVK